MKKRFIAGAVCPRCAEMDKIVMYDDDTGHRYRECVACDFKEVMQEEEKQIEPLTRVNKGLVGQLESIKKVEENNSETQVVELIDLEKNKTLH